MVLDPERAKSLFLAAVDIGSRGERAGYLQRECGADTQLRARVEALLAADDAAAPLPEDQGADAFASENLNETIAGDMSQSQESFSPSIVLPPQSYVVGREIAHGGMGCILQAEDRKLGRVVAMKVMKLDAAASDSARARFIREATVLARLEHPNIVPIHELGWDSENRPYYTMKLVQGRTLQAIIDGLRYHDADFIRHFTLDRLLTIFRKICDALSLAHAKGVIHRDLKPANVMVGEFGEVLVMDWGLAKIQADAKQAAEEAAIKAEATHAGSAGRFREFAELGLRSSANVTLDGQVLGTPLYMSPEQACGRGAEIDQQSDIFSLGGILYALLTLHPPVDGKTADEIIGRIKRGQIQPPTVYNAGSSTAAGPFDKLRAGKSVDAKAADPRKFHPLPHCPGHKVPAALSAVTMRALAVDRSKRYATVAEFAADIEAYQGGFATRAEEAGLLTQLRLLIRRHRREFAIAFAAWFVITGLAIWFVLSLRQSERKATRNATEAIAAKAEAQRNADAAQRNADAAQRSAEAAKTAEGVAVREKESTREAMAKLQLDLAEKEFERGKFVEEQKILAETPEAFRDANWRFLRANSHDYTARLGLARMGGVEDLHVLPGGDRFVALGWYGWIGTFDLKGHLVGPRIQTGIRHHAHPLFGCDSAGARVAFADSTNEVAVYELATGKMLGRWKCDLDGIRRVKLSPDGERVLVQDAHKVIVCDALSGAAAWTRSSTSADAAFSPDGRTVAILVTSKNLLLKVEILDAATAKLRTTLEAPADNPKKTALQFNQAGDMLACLGGDEVILWDPRNGRKIGALHLSGETATLLNPSGDVLATVAGTRIRLWDVSTGRLLRSLNGAQTPVAVGGRTIAFAPDGKSLLSSHHSGEDGLLAYWPVRLPEQMYAVRSISGRGRVLFSRDGSTLYAFGRNGIGAWGARLGTSKWALGTNKPGHSGPETGILGAVEDPADQSILFADWGKKGFTRVSRQGEVLGPFGHSRNGTSYFVSLSHNGKWLAAGAGVIEISDLATGEVLTQLPVKRIVMSFRPGVIESAMAFCLNDQAIATFVHGGITVWDWKSGKSLREIPAAQTGSVDYITSSADGTRLATCGPDRWIRVWDAATGRMESAFRAHWESVNCLKFSPDGHEILSGGEDGSVRIHDAVTGEQMLVFYGNTSPVADVDFSPDGNLIAAIATDSVTTVWDRKTSSAAAIPPRSTPATWPTE